MSYLPITIIAYIINSFSLMIDKNLIEHSLKNPLVYTFYVGVLSLLAVFLIPLGFTLPSLLAVIYSIASGLFFILAIFTYFWALKSFPVTVVAPVVGALNPLIALSLGLLIFQEHLAQTQYLGVFLLILGGIILTSNLWLKKQHINKLFLIMIFSGVLFGLSYVLLRQAFLASSFINGMVISRVSMTFFVLILLLSTRFRSQIFASRVSRHYFLNRSGALLLSSQLAGASSGIMVAFAVSLASPALVNSLYGIQFIIVFIVTWALSKKYPHLLDETINKKTILQKIIATILIALGLVYLIK